MQATEYTLLVFGEIEKAVGHLQRDLRKGVLPREVMCRLPYGRAEGSLRRDMLAMYEQGRLVRLGGYGARQGYRLPSALERLAWRLNQGMWPVGAERVKLWVH